MLAPSSEDSHDDVAHLCLKLCVGALRSSAWSSVHRGHVFGMGKTLLFSRMGRALLLTGGL